jgi:hypothetical protein
MKMGGNASERGNVGVKKVSSRDKRREKIFMTRELAQSYQSREATRKVLAHFPCSHDKRIIYLTNINLLFLSMAMSYSKSVLFTRRAMQDSVFAHTLIGSSPFSLLELVCVRFCFFLFARSTFVCQI